MSVTVIFPNRIKVNTTPEEMASLCQERFPVSARVSEAEGEGFDLIEWYAAAAASQDSAANQSPGEINPAPTHLIVRAADEFQATIPWEQLTGSFIQYALNGLPLTKGYPIRIYVPNGSSACLNVKSVLTLRFVADPTLGGEAEYGFMNEVSPDQMTKGLKAR